LKREIGFFYFIVLIMFYVIESNAQTINYKDEPVLSIIKKIEENTKQQFNYNPDALQQFTFTGKLSLDNVEETLLQLSQKTPFQFEQSGSTVLIILPKPINKTICGYVSDEDGDLPLTYANVHLNFTKKVIATDEKGYFKQTVICYPNEQINISYLGYENKSIAVGDVEEGNCPGIRLSAKENMLDIDLVVKDYILPSVEEGNNYSSIGLNYGRMVAEENFLDSDVLQNIQILPGLTSIDETATNINIRGNLPGHNITRWENVQLYNAGHFFGMLSAINPYLVNNVQVYKSSFHPNLGNTVGGVIDISLSDKIASKFNSGLGVDMTKVFGYFNIPLIKNQLSLSLSAQYASDELIPSPTLNIFKKKVLPSSVTGETEETENFEERFDADANFYDVQAKLNYQPSNKWLFNASFFKAHDDFEHQSFSEAGRLSLEKQITTNSMAMQVTSKFKPSAFMEFTVYGNYSNYNYLEQFELSEGEDKDEDEAFEKEGTFNKVETVEAGLQYKLQHHQNWISDAAISFEDKNMSYEIEENSLFDLDDFEEKEMLPALFFHADLSTTFSNPKWLLNLGLRNTYHTGIKKLFFSPRGNVQYKLTEALKVKASAGFHYQFISQLAKFENNNLNNNNPIWYINAFEHNEVLNAQKFSFGTIFQQNNWLFDAEAYHQITKNLPAVSTVGSSENVIDFLGEEFSRGIDVLALKKWRTLSVWANYTLSKNEYTFNDINANPFPAPNDHRHNLSINSSYKIGNWQCALNYHFRTSLPYSGKPEVTYEYEDEEDEFDDVVLNYTNINNFRVKGFYSRFDTAVSYEGTLFKDKIKFNTRLAVINLFNKTNTESINFHLVRDETTGLPTTVQIKKLLLPVTPQFTFHLSW